VLAVDCDPEAGLSRDMLGPTLSTVPAHLQSFLETPVLTPPPILSTGIDGLSLLPCPQGSHRYFRLFEEHSLRLREGLDLLEHEFDYILLDLANQFDNIAQMGMAAVDYLILPVELTADCADRVEMALEIITEAKVSNPGLKILGALSLANRPYPKNPRRISVKEHLIFEQFQERLGAAGIPMFSIIMTRSAASVEEARSNFDDRLLHWTARRRFGALMNEIVARVRMHTLSPSRHGRSRQQARTSAATPA